MNTKHVSFEGAASSGAVPLEASKLKPCPFCGGSAFWQSEHERDGFGLFWAIRCGGCGNGTQQHYVSHGNDCPEFRDEVRAAWNQRPTTKHADKCGIYNFASDGKCTCGKGEQA
jgi:hypothetical protein